MNVMRYIFFVWLLMYTGFTHAQLAFDDLYFHSTTEEELFQKVAEGVPDYVGLLIHAQSEVNLPEAQRALDQLKQIEQTVRAKNVLNKSVKKQSKAIYHLVHEELLYKYELENAFIDVFLKGYYNCVSASAVYAITFDRLGIPYAIVESPQHVYLIAWPETEGMVIESTNPTNGYFTVKDRFKESYVRQLIAADVVDERDYHGLSYAEIYNEIAGEENKVINMQQLVGIQYSNLGLYEFENERYLQALRYLEKSRYLYPTEMTARVANSARAQYLNKVDFSEDEHVKQLIRWVNDTLNAEDQELVLGLYAGIVKDYLQMGVDVDRFHMVSQRLIREAQDSTLKADLTFGYHFETTRNAYQKTDFEEALAHADSAMFIRPTYTNMVSLLMSTFISYYQNSSEYDQLIAKLHSLEARHATLMEEGIFQSLKGELYLRKALYSIGMDQISTAAEAVLAFERCMEIGTPAMITDKMIPMVYGEMAGYYFGRGSRTKARQYVDRGLEYAPGSFELIRRKQALR